MEERFNLSGKKVLTVLILFFFSKSLYGQFCDSETPTFNVDLSENPNMSWTSPLVVRDGFCCGADNPDNCIEFVITLNDDATAINFTIATGAVPPGAMYYQIDCGPITTVGSPICITGTGPHHLTFCKPGNNANTYSIISYSAPIIGPDLTLGAGCSGEIFANYYEEASIEWTSIAPGDQGDFDDFLNCTTGCDTVMVSPVFQDEDIPEYIDYLVCGTDIGGCDSVPVCDTVRVYLNPPLAVSVDPDSIHLCYDGGPVEIIATVTGGQAPFFYQWNTGAETPSITVGPGIYVVNVSDSFGCMIATDTAVVTQDTIPISIQAGPDQNYCNQSLPLITLNGTVQGASGAIWSGGNGTFLPENTNLNVTYQPTLQEINAGSVMLFLTNTGNSNCGIIQDTVEVFFEGFTAQFTLNLSDGSCTSENTGSAWITGTSESDLMYSWDMGPFTSEPLITGLEPGNHQVTILNALGCDTTIEFTITVNTYPMLEINPNMGSICSGGWIAFVNNVPGSQNWNYVWDFGDGTTSNEAMPIHQYNEEGNYLVSVSVTNGNNCTVSAENVTMVSVYPYAIANFEVSSTELNTLDPVIQLTNYSSGANNFIWSFGDGTGSNEFNPEHEYSESGSYQIMLWATNPWGCNDSTFVAITIREDYAIFVPNTFTPDGDAHNSTFLTKGYGILDQDFTFQIFNRWGELVFESHDMSVGWDGMSINQSAYSQDGTYSWMVYFTDVNHTKHQRLGHVNLLK